MPAITLSIVDFPAPDSPNSEQKAPSGTEKDTSLSTVRALLPSPMLRSI